MLIKLSMCTLHGQTLQSFIITGDTNQILEMGEAIPPPPSYKQSFLPHKNGPSWIELKNVARSQQYQLLAVHPFSQKSSITDIWQAAKYTSEYNIISLAWLFFLLNLQNSQCHQANLCLLIVNNRSTRKRCKICSKLAIKTPKRRHWRRSGIFIVNSEHISHLFLVLLLLTLKK